MKSSAYAVTLINTNYKHILEFGVEFGRSITAIRDTVNSLYDNQGISVIGFDSFVGLPEDWNTSCSTLAPKGWFSQDGKIPDIEGVKFYKGWFEDTIPEYIKTESQPLAMLHIDCDLYSSTKTVLYGLKDYIVKDTIILFDEWLYTAIDGDVNLPLESDHEQKAFYEWVDDFNINYEFLEYEDVSRKIVKIL
jgi:hypothetical protein